MATTGCGISHKDT